MAFFQAVLTPCVYLEFFMVDDKDIPISYIFYVIAVIAIVGFLIIGGLFLWLR